MDVKLVMFKPNGQRKDIPIPDGVSVIGRGENCELRIPLEKVSRRHCEVCHSEDGVKVKDLASSNGTYVNNKRVNECELKAGDRLVVDPVTFTVQIDGLPEQIAPAVHRSKSEKETVESKGDEEVVELEADGGAPTEELPVDLFAAAGADSEEVDPISALEALASETRRPEPKKAPVKDVKKDGKKK